MPWKVRALTVIFMTLIMVAMVTLIATWLNLGLVPHFLREWARAAGATFTPA